MDPRRSDYELDRGPRDGPAQVPGQDARASALDGEPTVVLEESSSQGSPLTSSTASEIQRTIDRQELRGDQERFRRTAILGAFLFPAFWPVDWIAHILVEPIHIGWFAVLRLLPIPLLLLFARLTAPGRVVSRRQLTLYECTAFAFSCSVLGLTIVDFRGLESPYYPGLTLVMLLRAVFMPEPWRRSLPSILICWISLPVVLAVAAVWDAEIARQWTQPAARGTFILHQVNLTWTAVVATLGGHTMSVLRRSVFEARAVGRYRLKRRIGRGAMGEVWTAGHPRLRQDVAIKLLDRRLSENPHAVARFEREVAATARLAHPNTVRILDYGVTDDGLWYYAMELLEGSDLASLVRDGGPLGAARAARIALQATRAIGEAHDQGVIHRDLKPENVFVVKTLRDGDLVKVLDFGIAKQAQLLDPLDPNLTQSGVFLGTPRYVSPEVAQGRPATAESDVYGLAGILYFLLTGTPPFQEASLGELMLARVHRDVEPPSVRLGAAVPPALEAIVLKALARDPSERHRDANELAGALANWLERVAREAGGWRME